MSTETQILRQLGKYTFKKPINVNFRQKEDQDGLRWIAENKYLEAIGSGKTKEEALERFEGHLDAGVCALETFPPEKMSKHSREVFAPRMNEYIDVKKVYNLICGDKK